jgi:hypothetical protein
MPTGTIKTKRTLLPSGEWKLVEVREIDGKPVTLKQWRKVFPKKAGVGVTMDGTGTYPHNSMAAGVHPRQVGEAMEHAKKNGVPTDFTPDGQAIFTSRNHRRAYLRLLNMRDNNAYGRV